MPESTVENPSKYSNLPAKVLSRIVFHIHDHQDQVSLMLVCKGWSRHISEEAYRAPPLTSPDSFERLMGLLNTPLPIFPYPQMIRELDISGLAADNLYMGDLNSALTICPNIEIFRLENCFHISNMLVRSLADYCVNIKQVDLPGCPITDTFIPQLTKKCKKLESLDLSFTNVTLSSLVNVIVDCENLLHVDFTECQPIDENAKPLDLSTRPISRPLRLLNLRSTKVTDDQLKFVVTHCSGLENVILDSCQHISDDSIIKLAQKCLKLRRLDCSFSDLVTDKSLQALAIRAAASNGGSLEQLYLTACDVITVPAVQQLALKAAKLKILVLDGCERILGTFVQDYASRREELECTLEGDFIRKMAMHSAGTTPMTPPYTPERKKDDGDFKVEVEYVPRNVEFKTVLSDGVGRQSPSEEDGEKIVSKPSSTRSIRRKSSRVLMDADADPQELVRHERQERIREKRRSRSERGTLDFEPSKPPTLPTVPSGSISTPKSETTLEKTLPQLNRRRQSELQPTAPAWDAQSSTWGNVVPVTTTPPLTGKPFSADPWSQPPAQTHQPQPPTTWTPNSTVPQIPSNIQASTVNAPIVPLVSGRRQSAKEPILPVMTSEPASTILASGRAARAAQAAQAAAANLAHSSLNTSTIPSKIPEESAPTEPPTDGSSLLIASGRRRRQSSVSQMQPLETPKPKTPSPPANVSKDWMQTPMTPPQQSPGSWGANPSAWNNPTQLTAQTSTWTNGNGQSQFVDPWARNNQQPKINTQDSWTAQPGYQTNPGQSWSAAPIQQSPQAPSWTNGTTQPNGAIVGQQFGGSQDKPQVYFDRRNLKPVPQSAPSPTQQQPTQHTRKWNEQPEQGGFVFSNPKRGKMLLKLKIETKSGGHQTLAVHELDDPQQLATEFCAYWDMVAFRDPLLRLITVRKTNAIRLRQPQN